MGTPGKEPASPHPEIRVNLERLRGEGLKEAEVEENQESRSKELDSADFGCWLKV